MVRQLGGLLTLVVALLAIPPEALGQSAVGPDSLTGALLGAIERGDTERALSLLADVEAHGVFTPDTTRDGESLRKNPLHLAAQYGRAEVVQALVTGGADVEARTANGVTPLGYAATYGHPGAAQVLLSAGARHDAVYPDSSSALLVAAGWQYHAGYHTTARGFDPLGHGEVFRLLHRAGASLDERTYVGGTLRQPFGVLDAAAAAGRVGILAYVVEADTSGALLREGGTRAFTYAAAAPNTPSAVSDPLPALRLLHASGVRPDAEALGRMLIGSARWGVPQSAQFLIEVGAPVDFRQPPGERDAGHTPLTLAARGGHLRVVRVLLSAGADITKTGVNGRTPLEFAVMYDRRDVADFIEHYVGGHETR